MYKEKAKKKLASNLNSSKGESSIRHPVVRTSTSLLILNRKNVQSCSTFVQDTYLCLFFFDRGVRSVFPFLGLTVDFLFSCSCRCLLIKSHEAIRKRNGKNVVVIPLLGETLFQGTFMAGITNRVRQKYQWSWCINYILFCLKLLNNTIQLK